MTTARSLTQRALLFGALALLTTGLASACEVRHVELGAGGVDAGSAAVAQFDAAPGSAYGCGDWIDDELRALRVGSCEGYCTSSPDRPYDLDGKLAIMAGTAGRWAYCGGHLGPADAIGIEFAPGCRLFFLRYDANSIAVRGTEASYQADYDMLDPRPEGAPAQIDLHFSPTNTVRMDVEAFRCPERVRLRYGDQTLDLARLEGHGGTGMPIK